MTHLTSDELRQWRDAPTPGMRERVVAHLAECDACSGACAELMRTREAGAGSVLDAAEFRERGYRVTGGSPSRVRFEPWFRPAAVLAACLLVVVAAWRFRVAPEDGVTRGTAGRVDLLSPTNDAVVDGSASFEWRSSPDDTCRVRIYDMNRPEAPIVERPAASGERVLNADGPGLTSGITYRWFVECRSAGGATTTSPAGRFRWR